MDENTIRRLVKAAIESTPVDYAKIKEILEELMKRNIYKEKTNDKYGGNRDRDG